MEDIQFSSIKELYERLKPALECKESEIKKMGFSYIKKKTYGTLWKIKNGINLPI